MRDWPSVSSTLHVAPEPPIAGYLKNKSIEYVSIDVRRGLAMRQEDLTGLTFEDQSFSLVFCSHVLEHIPDDASAIREMRRVLEPSGVLVVLVPVKGDVTDEEELDDPEQRFQRYGLVDHVRQYGMDVIDRLQGAFEVEHQVTTDLPIDERRRLGLGTEEHAFICRPC